MVKNPPAMQETQFQSLVGEDPLEKEMATHSSILAWRLPWAGESGGLPSMGGHEESDMTKPLSLKIFKPDILPSSHLPSFVFSSHSFLCCQIRGLHFSFLLKEAQLADLFLLLDLHWLEDNLCLSILISVVKLPLNHLGVSHHGTGLARAHL